ncbi:MAG: hypothetical protein NT027_12780, partial [Proteobacteria bacterium]|nr:hypothetical protein [Pseudomonadota bacterium]
LWRLYFFRRKMRQMETKGLFQYGVYLDETKLIVRILDADDELIEYAIERSSIQSVKEAVSSYTPLGEHVPVVTRRLVITWTENQKSWYIAVDRLSFSMDNFIALGRALDVTPAENNSAFKD